MNAAARRAATRTAAEEDARNLLLAGGYDPNDHETLAALLLPPPGVRKMLLTPQEFREAVGISEAAYYRSRRDGRGPELVRVMGSERTVRIKREEVEKWIALNTVPTDDGPPWHDDQESDMPAPPLDRLKRRRKVLPVQANSGKRKPSMYDPPKKPPKKLRRVV